MSTATSARLRETTRTKVFGLFMIVDGAALTLPQLVRLGAAAGLSATNVKSHVSRMVDDGSLARSGGPRAGMYAPTPARRRIVEAVRGRLREARPAEPWNGRWWMLALHRPGARRGREQARRVLRFAGLRPWRGDTWLRPAWPREEMRERVPALAARFGCVACEGFVVGDVDVARMFGVPDLEQRAARLVARLEAATRTIRSGRCRGARALRLWLDLGGRVVRFATGDPRLPHELLGDRPASPRVTGRWREFERVAREIARAFVEEAR